MRSSIVDERRRVVPNGTLSAKSHLGEKSIASSRWQPTAAEVGDSPPVATLRLPAEALIRLVYGRLDPDHTQAAVPAEGVDLDTLRGVFLGF